MKKIGLFVAVISIISLASCSKDRTCTCTTTVGSNAEVTTVVYVKSKKADARQNCMSMTEKVPASGSIAAYEITRVCVLK